MQPNNNVYEPIYMVQNGHYYQTQLQNNEQENQNMGLLDKIRLMIFYLQQQQLSAELLPFRENLFEFIRKQVKQQEQNLKIYKKEDDLISVKQLNYKYTIYSMEIEKYNFILKHYLKVRLQKIQKCSFYYFKNMSESQNLMSKSQVEFLKKYVDLRYKYYEKNAFKGLIKNFRGVGGMQLFLGKPEQTKLVNSNQSNSSIQQPDMKQYVFVKLNRNPNEFRYKVDMPINDVPQEESQIASPNEILFIPYGVARSLISRSSDGDMQLV